MLKAIGASVGVAIWLVAAGDAAAIDLEAAREQCRSQFKGDKARAKACLKQKMAGQPLPDKGMGSGTGRPQIMRTGGPHDKMTEKLMAKERMKSKSATAGR